MMPGVDPAIQAALIGLAGSAIGFLISHMIKKRVKSEDAAAMTLAAQLQGWKEFAAAQRTEIQSLRAEVEELERRLTACEQDRVRLWARLRNEDEKE